MLIRTSHKQDVVVPSTIMSVNDIFVSAVRFMHQVLHKVEHWIFRELRFYAAYVTGIIFDDFGFAPFSVSRRYVVVNNTVGITKADLTSYNIIVLH
jgi:hypothetical protein